MNLAINFLVAIIAVEHMGFLLLEMFLWQKPLGQKVFRTTPQFAKESATLAANQGLYNGFLVAGLLWSLLSNTNSYELKIFFLSCVLVAGVFGGATVSRRIFYVQALPAALALVMLFAS